MREDPARRREQMVAQQIVRRGIRDEAVADAMRRVPREKFVPEGLAEFAYDDSPLPLIEEQTISQPYIVALMSEAMELGADDRVLEIGTGSGYAAAVLGEIVSEVFTIERHPRLADHARQCLEALGYRNVHVRTGDGTLGWPDEAPFDAIVVTAGGPSVPRSLREQLAVGGRLVIPVGERVQRLLRVRRTSEERYAEEDLGLVLFVPLIGEQGWTESGGVPPAAPGNAPASGSGETNAAGPAANDPPGDDADPPGEAGSAGEASGAAGPRAATPNEAAGRAQDPADIIAAAAEPFDHYHSADLKPLLERIGDARVILLGEASHGTAEFYEMRARITRELIEHKNVRIVAVEADWPDARQIDRFVRGAPAGEHPERAFSRFPTWMWANRQVLDFVHALREDNAGREPREQVGFYGLDLYSMYTSIRAILAYLDDVDPEAAAVARTRYGCLQPWEEDPAAYGAAALRGRFDECADDVVRMLRDLLDRRLRYETRDGERFFDAARNAALVSNAEHYYRAMYYGPHESWNLRDEHMFATLQALLERRGAGARAVVWAHNSHVGDAGATSMSASGETNVGELCRRAFGDACYLIGFGTDHGTVAAADDWDGPMRVMDVRPAHDASYERLFHDSGVANALLPVGAQASARLREALEPERLERAIGVIYRPRTERASHYFHATLPRQFDEWVWFDETRAVEPLSVETDPAKLPETFPFGL